MAEHGQENVFLADGVRIVGDVALGRDVSVWYNAVIRGDNGRITIGDETNIQDNCTIHTQEGYDLVIGRGVTVGHGAILHGLEIGDNTVIGMGAILMNGTRIGKNCIIGAGALVTQNTQIPDGSMAFGSPAKVIRPVTEEEIGRNRHNCEVYLSMIKQKS